MKEMLPPGPIPQTRGLPLLALRYLRIWCESLKVDSRYGTILPARNIPLSSVKYTLGPAI